jgi:indolepyruvate ferredoxin oxidoreductase beta subunit
MERERITIAILALGGQGGGVLADWLVALGESNGYFVQATSVPGVAQRTGSTIYYLELFPEAQLKGRQPTLALMPAPGDVDIVIASELMEAGRAILRGLVTKDRTCLITSSHRIYAISEKSAISGGLADSGRVLEAASKNAKSVITFDMEMASARTNSTISAVMLGALAASDALPFSPSQFEAAIRASGIAIQENLAGFNAGLLAPRKKGEPEAPVVPAIPQPTTKAGRTLCDRAVSELPAPVLVTALHGVRKLMDYQDAAYASLYLDRLRTILPLDDKGHDWLLTLEVARALALWMSYEDVMRVAQQKIRASRAAKVRTEVNAASDQIIHVTEYMHPRWQELCDSLPASFGARLLASTTLKRLLTPRIEKGRYVRTTNVGWFLLLQILASRRRARRGTLRFAEENKRIERWLALIAEAAPIDYAAAVELARAQNLIKGYGETHTRGLRKFNAVADAWSSLRSTPNAAQNLRQLREAAVEDEDGGALAISLRKLA